MAKVAEERVDRAGANVDHLLKLLGENAPAERKGAPHLGDSIERFST